MDDARFEQLLLANAPQMRWCRNEPMSAHTTFKVGGPARYFLEPSSVDEVAAAVEAARQTGMPWRVMGCGSNILVADEGVDAAVICLGLAFAHVAIAGTHMVAQAGATNEAVAETACAAGLAGYEFASGIPGSIGGAAIMNAGAYDGEFKDVGVRVKCLTPAGDVVDVSAEQAAWGYRHSMMSDEGYVVLEAEIALQRGDEAEIRARMDDLAQRRAAKQPLELGSAGSTFKRPEGYFAGKLIQDAGMRGYRVGGAGVSGKHAGFVVNYGDATAADVLQVIADVQAAVAQQFGVQLEPEVRIWR